MSEYAFDAAFARDHFVGSYIAYAGGLTDAAHDYHEAIALVLLAMVTPDVRAHLKPFPKGLRTNLYAALIGSTTSSRKSTAKDIGVDLLTRVLPHALLSAKTTPEAFAEQLQTRPKQSSLWAVDEFAALLVQFQRREYMTGLVDVLLELYNGVDEYTYSRIKNPVSIKCPHLNVIGCAADTIFDNLHAHDVESGLLPRFAIVMPASKPKRMSFFESGDEDTAARNNLVRRLYTLCPSHSDDGQVIGTPRDVRFQPQALDVIDQFAKEQEEHHSGAIFRRLMPMVLKVATLSAVGSFRLTLGDAIIVTSEDAGAAIKVVTRWAQSAEAFMERLSESKVDVLVRRASEFMRTRKTPNVPRRLVARRLHVDSRVFADVEKTMLDRELIKVANVKEHAAGPAAGTCCWVWLEEQQRQATA